MTKLERFREDNGIRPSDLVAASGLAQKTVELIRKGHNTTLDSMKAITAGVSKLVGRNVEIEELFDLSVQKSKRRVA